MVDYLDLLETGTITPDNYLRLKAARERNETRDQIRAEQTKTLFQEQYDKYLRSDGWKFKRDVVLMYYGHTCAICNSSKRVQVHHRTYARLFFELPSDLIALCEDCHKMFHGLMDGQ